MTDGRMAMPTPATLFPNGMVTLPDGRLAVAETLAG